MREWLVKKNLEEVGDFFFNQELEGADLNDIVIVDIREECSMTMGKANKLKRALKKLTGNDY